MVIESDEERVFIWVRVAIIIRHSIYQMCIATQFMKFMTQIITPAY